MGYDVTLRLPGPPSRLALEKALNALAIANAEWYLDRWGRDLDPPSSGEEGGVRYAPRRGSSARSRVFAGAPYVFHAGHAGCGPLAAMAAGAAQASLRWERGVDADVAAEAYCVVLVEGDDPGGVVEDYWHAVVQTPDGIVDVTEGMRT